MDTTQLEADVTTAGKALLADAKSAGTQLATALAGSADNAIPAFVSDGEKTLLEFIPAFIRPEVEGLAGKAVSDVESGALALVKQGLGIALMRINALHV